ncbi:F0F1 ATP synthase subunit epsilon [Azospirillum sp. TSO35-2]|uniref:F0F1 ATP synthase subunit epsilon n=1 Tax=Azospirillum sp. TSO35-2 TaxID=716796 RepID=UPI000D61895B|nr:F0F1 ATP synthase subunit epsilon [Azospirillum sp. TSO35-2]PWC32995.1 ATP synthase F0F1 subunit epsilon [Azospirillum sp. TSO35-2]
MTDGGLSLIITTPTSVAAQLAGLRHLRAEDASGAFGVLPGHADLLTALAVSVVSWRGADGREGHCAVRGGVLTVTDGARVAVATREAVVGDDLHALEQDVLARFRRNAEDEGQARTGARRMHLAAVRHILAYLRPERRAASPFAPTGDGTEDAS